MKGQKITLNGHQLKQALSLIPEGDDPEHMATEITIEYREHAVSDEGEDMPEGFWAIYEEYPSEGWFGPLVAEPNAADQATASGRDG
jgi:hypothetical protein